MTTVEKQPDPPAGLSRASQRVWRELTTLHRFEPHELVAFERALAWWDRVGRAGSQRRMRAEGQRAGTARQAKSLGRGADGAQVLARAEVHGSGCAGSGDRARPSRRRLERAAQGVEGGDLMPTKYTAPMEPPLHARASSSAGSAGAPIGCRSGALRYAWARGSIPCTAVGELTTWAVRLALAIRSTGDAWTWAGFSAALQADREEIEDVIKSAPGATATAAAMARGGRAARAVQG